MVRISFHLVPIGTRPQLARSQQMVFFCWLASTKGGVQSSAANRASGCIPQPKDPKTWCFSARGEATSHPGPASGAFHGALGSGQGGESGCAALRHFSVSHGECTYRSNCPRGSNGFQRSFYRFQRLGPDVFKGFM